MSLSAHSKRLVTACLVLLLPILAVVCGGWVLFAVLALFSSLSLWEFYSLIWTGSQRIQTKTTGLFLSLVLLVSLASGSHVWTLLALLGAFWVGNLAFLFEFSKKGEQASYLDGLVFFAGLLYIPVTLHFFLFMNPMEIALVFGAVICSDTAAFYTGTLWGKSKIWPQVSPKKSWLGSIGSLSACLLFTAIFGSMVGEAPWWQYAYLGLALNVAAQLGDFFESALKRRLGIKDSGSILPGHGGLLDRLDSMVLALPVYVAVTTTFAQLVPRPGFTQLLGSFPLP